MVVMTIRQPEVGDTANIDLLDESRFPHTLEDAIGGNEAERPGPPLSASPDALASGEMAAGDKCFEDGDTLRRHPQAGATEQRVETVAQRSYTSL